MKFLIIAKKEILDITRDKRTLLMMIALFSIQKEMPELLMLQDLPTVGVIMGVMFLIGILMSLLASNMAVGKYLRMKEDNLYQ